MTSYKFSGEQWMGDIPSDWNITKIKWLTSIKRGASPRPIDDPKFFDDQGEYAWVRIADVSRSKIYLESTLQRMSELGSSLSVKREPGDIFLSIAGTVGKPCITKIKCCIHDGFVYFPDFKGDVKFLYYIFESGEPYRGLGKMGTQLNLNTDTVGSIFIPNIELKLQKKISNYLDLKTERIQTLITEKKRLLSLLVEKRQAMITEAVTKGLNPTMKMKDSGVDWIGEIPEHWHLTKMKYIGEAITGLTYSPNDLCDEFGTVVLRSTNIQKGKISLHDNVYVDMNVPKKLFTRKNDILICSRNGSRNLIGKNALISNEHTELSFGAFTTVFRSEINSFVYYVLNSGFFAAQLGTYLTSTINQLTIGNLKNMDIVLPPTEEQIKIIQYLDIETAKINASVNDIDNQIRKLKEYRQCLIYEAVTGKIDVRDFEVIK